MLHYLLFGSTIYSIARNCNVLYRRNMTFVTQHQILPRLCIFLPTMQRSNMSISRHFVAAPILYHFILIQDGSETVDNTTGITAEARRGFRSTIRQLSDWYRRRRWLNLTMNGNYSGSRMHISAKSHYYTIRWTTEEKLSCTSYAEGLNKGTLVYWSSSGTSMDYVVIQLWNFSKASFQVGIHLWSSSKAAFINVNLNQRIYKDINMYHSTRKYRQGCLPHHHPTLKLQHGCLPR